MRAHMRETIRNWLEDAETFVLEVIFEQRKGKRAALLRTTLLALSDRKSTRLNSSHVSESRMPSSA